LFATDYPRFQGFRVLLAQIPHGRAEELAVHFQQPGGEDLAGRRSVFDIVIAKSEPGHSSPSEFIRLGRTSTNPTPVVVPQGISDHTGGMFNPVRVMTISSTDVCETYSNVTA